MSLAVYLRQCTLLPDFLPFELPSGMRLPVGMAHANDGILTPDGFQWGHKITHWFLVQLAQGKGAMQVMSWPRLAKALKLCCKSTVSFFYVVLTTI